jgi:hypothetical protein
MMRITSCAARPLLAAALGLACLAPTGCGQKGLPAKVLHGSVSCGGEMAPTGQISFVPVEDAPGPTCAAFIVNGQYRIAEQGGVPLGKHRVQVDARKKTGRKVSGRIGHEASMIDEEVKMGPPIYAGEQSPLIVDVRPDSDGKLDIAIPRQ